MSYYYQVMAGHREGSMYKEFKCVIPTAAAFGGAILGLLRRCRSFRCYRQWHWYSYGRYDHSQL